MKNTLLLLALCASGGIVQGQVYTFTNATATGINGPTQAMVTTAYQSTTLAGSVTVTGGIQSWTVPTAGNYKIEVWGANGHGVYGGKGAYMSGEFNLNTGDVLKILVGQMGQCCSGVGTNQYGGGGGSFVVAATGNTPLIIAGGGGGGATFYSSVNLATSHNTAADASITTTAKNAVGTTAGTGGTAGNGGTAGGTAGGGGGFLTDGANAGPGGFAFVNGGVGGSGATPTGLGGFGGGGGITGQNNMRAGGGGGYSGGGGAGSSASVVQIGGGGGSYNTGANQVNTPALGTGHGQVVITSLAPPCNAPTGLTATGVTYNSANTSWGTVTGAVGYEYAVNTSSTPPATGTPTNGTSYSAPSLTPATTYYLHVRTQCATGFSTWSTYSFTTPVLPPCQMPDTLNVTNITISSADLSWNSLSTATGGYEYAVTQSVVPPASGTATSNTTHTETGLAFATQYYAHVRAECNGGIFSAWNTVPFVTPLPPCDSPKATMSNITNESADVNWTTVPYGQSYQVAVFSNPNPPNISGVPTTGLNYHATNLVSGKLYYVHLRTICSFDTSGWATSSFYSTVPASVATIGNSTNVIRVYPNPVTDVLSLQLENNPSANAYIVITDILGKELKREYILNKTSTIDVGVIAKGVYLLKYFDAGEQATVKFIKE